MIQACVPKGAGVELVPVPEGGPVPPGALWLDMHAPTPAERRLLEAAVGVELPTLEEMQEIESSSRLYQENGGTYMTATVLTRSEGPDPSSDVLTFVRAGPHLVTLRYADPKPIATFKARLHRQPALAASADDVLIGLLEQFVDRIADILEGAGILLDRLSRQVFQIRERKGRPDLQAVLRELGRIDDLASTSRESLVSLGRVVRYIAQNPEVTGRKDLDGRLKTLSADMSSLGEQAGFEAHKVNFLLDATLGMINIEQNAIIRILSVGATVLLPPTLIASVYGMNFEHMPELARPWGYPLALALIVTSAVVPYLWFKRKGWL